MCGVNLKESHINLVSLPDGVPPEEDRSKDVPKVISTTITTMSAKVPKLIEEVNAMDSHNKISCIIDTKNMGLALEVGHQLGIKGALFWPASATSSVSFDSMQRLIDEGIIDPETGTKGIIAFCYSCFWWYGFLGGRGGTFWGIRPEHYPSDC